MAVVNVAELSKRTGIPHKTLREVFAGIEAEMLALNDVAIVGFGTFRLRESVARRFETPITPTGVADIPAGYSPAFTYAKALRAKVREIKR